VSKTWFFWSLFIGLLLASAWFRLQNYAQSPPPGAAYQSWPDANVHRETETESLPLIIVHGIFEPDASLHRFASAIAGHHRRVILPNLFAPSRQEVNDSLLERLGYIMRNLEADLPGPYHLCGIGLGGLAAAQWASFHPEAVASLTLISSAGDPKHELLGQRRLNQAMISGVSTVVWTCSWMIPHFGTLDSSLISQKAVKAWKAADLREMEALLPTLNVPSLVLHGQDDPFVPVASAYFNHHRLPHSRLVILPNTKRLSIDSTHVFVQEQMAFLHEVELGTFQPQLKAGETVVPQRVRGTRFWFLATAIFIGTKFSEDLASVSAGLLVSLNIWPFWVAWLICLLGILIGDTAIYLGGRWLGVNALRKAPFSWFLNEERIRETEEWFDHRGPMVIIISRFIPASRLPVYLTAGILGVRFTTFFGFLFLAAMVWTPLIVGTAALIGRPFIDFIETYEQFALPGVLAFFLLSIILVKVIFPLTTRRGRRILYRKWVRLQPGYRQRNRYPM